MAVVVFKCDTCNREIEKIRKPETIEVIQRCVITSGCRGKLYQENVLQDYSRGTLPNDVPGLTNWIQRRKLYTHRQTLQRKVWTITHNLNTIPSVQIYGDSSGSLIPVTPLSIDIVDENTLTITLSRDYSGIAQLIARSSEQEADQEQSETMQQQNIQITNDGIITIAVLEEATAGSPATNIVPGDNITVNFFNSSLNTQVNYQIQNTTITSPWSDYNRVLIQNKVYNIYQAEPQSSLLNIQNGSSFYFNFDSVSYNLTTNNDKMFVLFAYPPQQTFDKATDKYLDVTKINSPNTQLGFISNQQLNVPENLIDNVYPPIRPL